MSAADAAGAAARGLLPPLGASPPVERVAAEERAAALGRRSLKRAAKVAGLRLAVRCMDLTTLEGADTPARVAALCRKAIAPGGAASDVPSVAAVCVYPSLVGAARRALAGSAVRVASVAAGFPSGLTPLATRVDEARRAVDAGADEIDMVIDRGAFLAGEQERVGDEIELVKEACGAARLKVILETGELGTFSNVRRASDVALHAGADFLKTSTGKIQPAATPGVSLVLLEAIRDFYFRTGRRVGMKPAGGIRTARQALHHLVLVKETLGDAWLDPELYRLGASTLLDDVLLQLEKERTGAYGSLEYLPAD
ncbi:MAG: deoxyribose-phosphate aldolase [Polyangiaceae bacterium]|nr:deoxyribose-phosphate aldolase [Polyangiaceae bacterium]